LLTVGAPHGALVDEPTTKAMEKILIEADLNLEELWQIRPAEVTYILLADGRIVKFVTLPTAVLGEKRVLDKSGTMRRNEALSVIDPCFDLSLSLNVAANSYVKVRSGEGPMTQDI